MRVMFAPIGSRGDVQPLLALAMELRARGHFVEFCCPPNFQQWVEEHGFTFHPVGRDVQRWLAEVGEGGAGGGSPIRVFREITAFLAEEVTGQVDAFRALISPEVDVVVQAALSVGAGPFAELHNIPLVQAHYSPGLLPSAEHGPILFPIAGKGPLINRALWWLNDVQFWRLFCKPLNKKRAELDLPPYPSVGAFAAPFGLALWDDALGGFPGDYEEQRARRGYRTEMTRPLGHLAYPHPEASLDPELDAWLDAGDPPVYFGFGSMPDEDPVQTFQIMREVAASLGVRAIVCAGWSGLDGVESSEACRVIAGAPHTLLFPRCRVVVSHGGAGTTAVAARAGAPQVIVPHAVDQFDWAHRLHHRGLAPRGVPRSRLNAARLREAVAWALLEAPLHRARSVAEALRQQDPVRDTADELERRFAL